LALHLLWDIGKGTGLSHRMLYAIVGTILKNKRIHLHHLLQLHLLCGIMRIGSTSSGPPLLDLVTTNPLFFWLLATSTSI
jgi:hypothetical protein